MSLASAIGSGASYAAAACVKLYPTEGTTAMTEDTQTDATYRADNGQLRAFVERRERLELDKQDTADAIKDLNTEIKSFGYDLPTFNKAIARRKLDRDTVAEQDATLEMYETALEGN